MYGLPTRSRDLVIGTTDGAQKLRTLNRDLEIAIQEYAPGNVLLHDKQELFCIGLTPRINKPGQDWQTICKYPWDRRFELAQCPHCSAWQEVIPWRSDSDDSRSCPGCQATSPLDAWKRHGCLEPAAFRTDFRLRGKNVQRSQGSTSFTLSADAKLPSETSWETFSRDPLELTIAASAGATVYRLNQGLDRAGFDFVWKTGESLDKRGLGGGSDQKREPLTVNDL